MQVITDPEIIRKLKAEKLKMVDEPWSFKADLLDRNWVIVPIEKGRHFEDEDAGRVAMAMSHLGCQDFFAITTECTDAPECYRFSATLDGLLEFSDSYECTGLNFLLIPESFSYAILCTSEDYNLYAGSREFVEECLGCEVEIARQQFQKFATDGWWEQRLLDVLERYTPKV